MSFLVNAIKNTISELRNLKDNWDGRGADAISEDVFNNALKFVESLETDGLLCKIEKEDITITPYGNVVFDFNSLKGLVSIEIGHSQIGFFTEFAINQNLSSEGITTDFFSIPKELKDALELL